MLTDDEIIDAIRNAETGHTSRTTLVALGRAVERALRKKLEVTAQILAESAKQHRCSGNPAHAALCDRQAAILRGGER